MNIIIHSQHGGFGGSTRLLLNLARCLGTAHAVALSLPGSPSPQLRALLAHFPDVKLLSSSSKVINEGGFDLALLHMPYSVESLQALTIPRKMAIFMEIVERHPVPLREEHCPLVERVLYLHPEQVAHLSPETRAARCRQMPIINNIDFVPTYRRSRHIGAVGGAHKTGIGQLLRFANALPGDYGVRVWSDSQLSCAGLAMDEAAAALSAMGAGRLQGLPVEVNMRTLMASYDALLHTPPAGNGTSIVVSDALQCGKRVVLSPLSVYRHAYGAMDGVLFSDAPVETLVQAIVGWGEADFRRIRDAYLAVYDREQALREWRAVVEE